MLNQCFVLNNLSLVVVSLSCRLYLRLDLVSVFGSRLDLVSVFRSRLDFVFCLNPL